MRSPTPRSSPASSPVLESRRPGTRPRTRVKLLGDWCTSETICGAWDKMTQGGLRWNNIEVTWRDEAVDYYAVINGLRPGEHSVPERTIVFSLEPPMRVEGRWSPVDPRAFLQV